MSGGILFHGCHGANTSRKEIREQIMKSQFSVKSWLIGCSMLAMTTTGAFAEVDAQYEALVQELSAMGLMYVHVLDHSAMGAPAVPAALKATLRAAFKGTFILAGGFDHASAEAALAAGQADLIGFGRPFLCNPDLVARMQAGAAMNAPDMGTFYTPGEKGYTDYPALSA